MTERRREREREPRKLVRIILTALQTLRPAADGLLIQTQDLEGRRLCSWDIWMSYALLRWSTWEKLAHRRTFAKLDTWPPINLSPSEDAVFQFPMINQCGCSSPSPVREGLPAASISFADPRVSGRGAGRGLLRPRLLMHSSPASYKARQWNAAAPHSHIHSGVAQHRNQRRQE